MLSAEIIAVGSELLTPTKTDTNSLWLTEKLNEIGIDVKLKTIVGDDELSKGAVVLRDMAGKQQQEIRLEELESVLTARKAS